MSGAADPKLLPLFRAVDKDGMFHATADRGAIILRDLF